MNEALQRREAEPDDVEDVDDMSSQPQSQSAPSRPPSQATTLRPTSQGGMLKRKAGHDLSHNCLSTMSEAFQGLAVEPDDMEDIETLQPVSRMKAARQVMDQMSIFIKTRDPNDSDVKDFVYPLSIHTMTSRTRAAAKPKAKTKGLRSESSSRVVRNAMKRRVVQTDRVVLNEMNQFIDSRTDDTPIPFGPLITDILSNPEALLKADNGDSGPYQIATNEKDHDEVAGAEEEPQDVHRSPPLHAHPPVSVPPPPHWSMSYEEYRSMQASHEHLCRCINASELTSARNHYDLVSMFRVFTSQESCLRLYLLFLFRSLFFRLIMRNGRSCSARVQQLVNYISDLETRVHVKKPLASRNQSNKQVDYWSQLAQGTLKINVDGAFNTRMDLKGKVVLPEFWTYCCINCMHVLSDLEFLEKKYKDIPFTVVGVHFAKFDNEKDLEAIRNAILRYGITHLVVNNGDMFLWRDLGVNSWPTLLLWGPMVSSLHKYQVKVAKRCTYAKSRGCEGASIFFLCSHLFMFLSSGSSESAADVVTDLDGNFIIQIGSTGEEGFRDGSFEDAVFNRPHGLAYDAKKNLLYGVDTENHVLSKDGEITEDVTYKVQVRWVKWRSDSEVLCDYRIPSKLKEKLYCSAIKPTMLCGTRCWATKKEHASKMSATKMDLKDSESSSIRALDLKTGGSRLLAGGDPFFAENLFKVYIPSQILKFNYLFVIAFLCICFRSIHVCFNFCSLEIMMVRGLKFFNIHWVLCGKDGQIYIADSYNHKADSVSLGNGSLVWVEDPDAAWIDGEIVEVKGSNKELVGVLSVRGWSVRSTGIEDRSGSGEKMPGLIPTETTIGPIWFGVDSVRSGNSGCPNWA
ncbi:hypothetical protein RHMOL_Rhmol10G0218300 [Rhododendron molle]|uniref:Uncharacterized protein n=1 Tax=Rhododendron molle TaxID=49168 RepID=A0ACC0M511_RHOML|nr:hypothetical protein RHMOL_Rhmol10G0218300 [Rhododendron molle]